MNHDLQQGIAAAKAGDKSYAFELLMRASQNPASAEQAWLWLSGVVDDDCEKLFCLDSVLKINPDNSAAQRGAKLLRQKGVFPAIPVYPEPERPAGAPELVPTSQLSPLAYQSFKATDAVADPVLPREPAHQAPGNRPDPSGLVQYAAMELANKRTPQEVEKALVTRGVSPKEAKAIVAGVEGALKQGRREKHKKRIIRGLIWTVLGTIITCGTYVFAEDLGGSYVLCYGAIIFGLIDLLIGMIGWFTSS